MRKQTNKKQIKKNATLME